MFFDFLKSKKEVIPDNKVKREYNFVSQANAIVDILNDYVLKLKEHNRKPIYEMQYEEEIIQDGEFGKPYRANYYRKDTNELVFSINYYPNSEQHLGGIKIEHCWEKEDIKAISEYAKLLGWQVKLKGDNEFKKIFLRFAVQLDINVLNPELKEVFNQMKDKYEESLKKKREELNKTSKMKN